jgi:HK97 family phage major capsid protein
MNEAELKSKRAAIVAKADTIQQLATDEGRTLTEEELSEFEGLIVQAETVTQDIERLSNQSALASRLGNVQADISKKPISKTRPSIQVSGPNYREDSKGGYNNVKEFFEDVLTAGKKQVMSERLAFRQAVGSDEMKTVSDPYGGFLVPAGFSPQLLQVTPEEDFITPRMTEIPMAKPVLNIPARTDKTHTSSVSGGLTVGRRPETVAATASRMQLEQVVLNATSNMGLAYVSQELLDDSPMSVAALMAAGFNQEFTSAATNERINGTGAGEPLGIANSAATISVAKESGQTADTIVYANIINMRARCWGYDRAIWMANHDTLAQLVQLASADNVQVWQPSAREDKPNILFGRPIFFTEYCETLGDKGDIYLVNWSQVLYGNYQPLRRAESIHVRFVNHENAFKFWVRDDARPWWLTALTPVKSAVTLSPYVTLAARA